MTIIVREICPKDFYWFALIENDFKDISHSLLHLLILVLILDSDEDNNDLHLIPSKCMPAITWWVTENIIQEKLMPLEGWLTLAFHLCKQRWDTSIDWLEIQPITKIQLMARIQSNFVEDQNREMKKASKGKK